MKIWHVVHGFAPELTGGTERVVEALARSMRTAGHEVTVVCGSIEPASSDRVDELEVDGLRVLRLHREDLYYESWWKAWSPLVGSAWRELLERERPDVVHVHHWLRMTSDLVRIARATGCRVAVTLHDYFTTFANPARRFDDDTPGPPPAASILGEAELRSAFEDHRDDFADEICAAHLRYAPSAAHAAGLAATAPTQFGSIGVSRPPLLQVPTRLPGGAERGKRLVTWGSIYPDKGLDLVFDALFSIGSGWSLEVWGEAHDPAYRDRVHARAQNMPVTFRGAFSTEDLGRVDADYAVLPSMCFESYGLTIDEAQCLGLPLIAADLPAYREHAPPESTVFFRPGDPGELAMLLVDETRLAELERPPMPTVHAADDAAQALLADYAAATDESGPHEVRMTDARRAASLFRRAEWRYWSALQGGDARAPDDGYLA